MDNSRYFSPNYVWFDAITRYGETTLQIEASTIFVFYAMFGFVSLTTLELRNNSFIRGIIFLQSIKFY